MAPHKVIWSTVMTSMKNNEAEMSFLNSQNNPSTLLNFLSALSSPYFSLNLNELIETLNSCISLGSQKEHILNFLCKTVTMTKNHALFRVNYSPEGF